MVCYSISNCSKKAYWEGSTTPTIPPWTQLSYQAVSHRLANSPARRTSLGRSPHSQRKPLYGPAQPQSHAAQPHSVRLIPHSAIPAPRWFASRPKPTAPPTRSSLTPFQKRARTQLERISRTRPGPLATAVSHAGTRRVVRGRGFGWPGSVRILSGTASLSDCGVGDVRHWMPEQVPSCLRPCFWQWDDGFGKR